MSKHRRQIITELASLIGATPCDHPLRVAIDGPGAAGKTTLAGELAVELRSKGRTVIHASLDGFHRPRSIRYARGRLSPEGYYRDARDLEAINQLLLDPLGPGGDRQYRTASFDLDRDEPIDHQPKLAEIDAILLVDGTFLQRPELRGRWDLVVFVEVDEALATKRGIERDAPFFGSHDAAEEMYALRYCPAYSLYFSEGNPRANAHILFENSDFSAPSLRIQKGFGL